MPGNPWYAAAISSMIVWTTASAHGDWAVMEVNDGIGAPTNQVVEPADPDSLDYLFWNATSLTFKAGNLTTDVHVSDAAYGIQQAIAAWDAVDSADSLDVKYGGTGGGGASGSDGKNSVFFGGSLSWNTWGKAYLTFDSDGVMSDSDIELNDDDFVWTIDQHNCTTSQSSTADTADIRSIAAHELGHALGLDHSTQDNANCPTHHGGSNFCPSSGGCRSDTESLGLRTMAGPDSSAYRFLYVGLDSVSVRFRHNNPAAKRLGQGSGPPVDASRMTVYPNPGNPGSVIRYDLREPGTVSVVVYNTIGQRVRTLQGSGHAQRWRP